MDRTVPAGAAILLDFIRKTEVGRNDRASYDVIYGHNQDKLPKPVTSMMIDEVIAAQSGWSRRFGSSATGGYPLSFGDFFPVEANFDLFGHPVREGFGKRGRPPYEPSERDRNKIKLLLALGWSIQRMANALAVSPATVKRYFRAELKARDAMRDRLDARRFELAWQMAEAGNVGAFREFGRMLEKNDLMKIEADMASRPQQPERPERQGKKAIDAQRAIDADADLMAELEQEAAQNAHH